MLICLNNLFRVSLFVVVFFIMSCGGGSDGDSPPPPTPQQETDSGNQTPAVISIAFPARYSITEAESISIRGSISDDNAVASVAVNGEEAQSSDGFNTWTSVVSLNMGLQTIEIEAIDADMNVIGEASEIYVERVSDYLVRAVAVSLDLDNNRAIVVDSVKGALMSVDLSTGANTLISDEGVLPGPTDIVLDSVNNNAYVSDRTLDAILNFDLDDGSFVVLSGNAIPNGDNQFSDPMGIALDQNNNRILVADGSDIIGVDLNTGSRTLLIENFRVSSTIWDVEHDADSGRTFIIFDDRFIAYKGVAEVDLDTGSHVEISSNGFSQDANTFYYPRGLVADIERNRILVTDQARRAILSVDLDTGERLTLTNYDIPNADNRLYLPNKLALDGDQLIVTDVRRGLLVEVGLVDGVRSIITDNSLANFMILLPASIDFVASTNKVVIADSLNGVLLQDLNDGEIEIVTDANPENAGPIVGTPFDVKYDAQNSRALLANYDPRQLVTVGLNTGSASTLVELPDPPVSIAMDTAGNRALVLASASAATPIYEVDLSSGIYAPVFVNTLSLSFDGIVYDANRTRLLADGLIDGDIYSIDMASGDVALLFDDVFSFPGGYAIDQESNTLFISHGTINQGEISMIDLESNEITQVSNSLLPNSNNTIYSASKLSFDKTNNRLFMLDKALKAIYLIDVSNGQRVLLAR